MRQTIVNPPYTFSELRASVSSSIHQTVKPDTLYEWTVQALVRDRGERKHSYTYREKVMVLVFGLGMRRYGVYREARNYLLADLKENPWRYIPNERNQAYTVTVNINAVAG